MDKMNAFAIISCVTVSENNYRYVYKLIEEIRCAVTGLILVCDRAAHPYFVNEYMYSDVRIILGTDNHVQNYSIGFEVMRQCIKEKPDKVVFADTEIVGPVNDLAYFWDALNNAENYIVCAMPPMQERPFSQYAFCGMDFCLVERLLIQSEDKMTEEKWQLMVEENFARVVYPYSSEDSVSCLEFHQELEQHGLPFIPIELFLLDYAVVIDSSIGNYLVNIMEYVSKNTDYDTDIIWDFLIKARNIADLTKLLHLNFVIPTQYAYTENNCYDNTAIVIHIYYMDMIDTILKICLPLFPLFDFYFTTDTEAKAEKIREGLRGCDCRLTEVRLIENRGRDVSSLLVGVKDIIDNYCYICFAHDKKTSYVGKRVEGEGFAEKCICNVLYNELFCQNVINIFEENPRLGIAFPPEPNHASFFPVLGNEWSNNFELTQKVAQTLGLEKYLDKDKEVIAPLGTCFWFRTKALKPLFDKNWEYEDFPEEPNGIDGTILHACERIYAYVAQGSGYYPAYIMADKWFTLEYTNLHYFVRSYNAKMLSLGMAGKPSEMVAGIVNSAEVERYEAIIKSLNEQNEELRNYVEHLEKRVIPALGIRRRLKKLLHLK